MGSEAPSEVWLNTGLSPPSPNVHVLSRDLNSDDMISSDFALSPAIWPVLKV